jgi:hypothetical protein
VCGPGTPFAGDCAGGSGLRCWPGDEAASNVSGTLAVSRDFVKLLQDIPG